MLFQPGAQPEIRQPDRKSDRAKRGSKARKKAKTVRWILSWTNPIAELKLIAITKGDSLKSVNYTKRRFISYSWIKTVPYCNSVSEYTELKHSTKEILQVQKALTHQKYIMKIRFPYKNHVVSEIGVSCVCLTCQQTLHILSSNLFG